MEPVEQKAPKTPTKTKKLEHGPIKIKAAYLHKSLVWPGIAGAETTISKAKIPGLVMSLIEGSQTLLLEAKGQQTIIPDTNYGNALIDDS